MARLTLTSDADQEHI